MADNNEKNNIHKGHRQRVYDKFKSSTSIATLSEVEVLEFLLFSVIPMKDTNPIAHDLLDQFGTLYGVLTALPEQLMKIKNITKNAAYLLPFIFPVAARANENRVNRTFVGNSIVASDYIKSFFSYRTSEAFGLIALDINDKVIHAGIINEGGTSNVNIDMRKLTNFCLSHCADRVILCHNHPTGNVLPSNEDVEVTKSIFDVLARLGIIVVDHIIVGPDSEYFSFYEGEIMAECYEHFDRIYNTKYSKDFNEKFGLLKDKRTYIRQEVQNYSKNKIKL